MTATTEYPIGMLSELLNNMRFSAEDCEKAADAIKSVRNYLSDAKVFDDIELLCDGRFYIKCQI